MPAFFLSLSAQFFLFFCLRDMEYFVKKGSIVREIWGKGDVILFIFAGASAEFALNKAVDWLYFTGNLPAYPLARLFSTVGYARKIVFSEQQAAFQTIDKIGAIHAGVEKDRRANIPEWAYRDVLFMLIDYSIRSYELLERKLSGAEKEEVFHVFHRLGIRMGINGLPGNFQEWMVMRENHLEQNMEKSELSLHLYKQYRKHLGFVRYFLLLEAQKLVVPEKVKELLSLKSFSLLTPILRIYKFSRKLRLEWLLKSLVLPPEHKEEIKALDVKM